MSTFASMWSDLSGVGRHGGTGGYRRYAWTPEDAVLREWFVAEAGARGLDVVEDRVGNQWAWWGDVDRHLAETGEGGIVTGSHLDSVPDGGAFDGPLGVVSGFAAIDALRAKGVTPARPLAVANFVDEEGARFGVACAGSRVLTGALAPERALGLTDPDGTSLAEARRAAGRSVDDYGPDEETLRRVAGFVELHVEQGVALGNPKRLADLRLDAPGGEDSWGGAVAVGTAIHPHGRWRIDLPGVANHAGTTALGDRSDAMLLAAEITLAVREAARAHGCVATVGRLEVTPNGINAIPSHVRLWLDARGPSEAQVHRTVEQVSARVADLGGTVAEQSWTGETPFTDALTSRIHQALRSDGESPPLLSTGAGHDAGVLATAGVPSAMLFVRNPTGVSHSPAEHADEADCLTGIEALTAVLEDLVGDGQEAS